MQRFPKTIVVLMSVKHQKLWRLWLAFYLAWTTATAVWIYDDAKQATQILLKSNDLNVDHQIAACDTMNKLAAQEGQDQKLMELYFTVYQKTNWAMFSRRSELSMRSRSTFLPKERPVGIPISTTVFTAYYEIARAHVCESTR